MPVRIVEVADIHLRGLGEQAAFRLELHAADEQIPAVPHVGAYRPLHGSGYPQTGNDGKHVAEL